jgi:hypothetical protein
MIQIPKEVGGAKVILYTSIDERHQFTGNCSQIVAGVLMNAMAGLAICQYENEDCFYLFGCDKTWATVTDTLHTTLKEAKEQAEFEYKGVSNTWQIPEE